MMTRSRKNSLLLFTTSIVVILLIAACSQQDLLLGVWTENGGDFHIRFHTNATVSQKAYFDDGDLTITGTYEIINDTQIRIDFPEGEWRGQKSGLYSFSVSEDTLTLDDLTFDRQPDVFYLE